MELINIRQAANLAKCHVATIQRWIAAGHLASWRRRGRVFVDAAAVLALFTPRVHQQQIRETLAAARKRRKKERMSAALMGCAQRQEEARSLAGSDTLQGQARK